MSPICSCAIAHLVMANHSVPFVTSMAVEPMITIPNHLPGAGGYCEHDILVITKDGNRKITGHPYGRDHMIVRN
jgi:hypothetical protein